MRKYRFLLFKIRFLGTAPDPADTRNMEHELRLATHQQRAGGKDDVSVNKLPQTKEVLEYMQRMPRVHNGILRVNADYNGVYEYVLVLPQYSKHTQSTPQFDLNILLLCFSMLRACS